MAINLQKYCDNKAMSGYGSALLYKDTSAGDTLYHLLLPLETVPAVNGSVDTFEFDLLTCPSKGKVEGKESLEEKEVEFLWHRDNVERLEALQGKVIDFLAVYADMTGRKFSGTIKVRPNDVSNDIARGTFTITPISASNQTISDCTDLIQDTVGFASQIPAKYEMYVGASEAKTINCVLDPATGTNATVTSDNTQITGAWANGVLTITANAAGSAVLTITASGTGYAPWKSYILVVATNKQ